MDAAAPWCRAAQLVAILAGVGALAAPAAARADVTVLQGNQTETTLPTWANTYAWPSGDGFTGWVDNSPAAGGYSFARGLESAPALWLWPDGARRYAPGEAFWSYEAPGTTRILSAAVDLNYPPRLLAHHCVRVALRAADVQPDSQLFCKPPGPPSGEGAVRIKLGDPSANPSSKLLTAGLELPCEQPNASACEKYLSAGVPARDGLRVNLVDMVLVDDDLPVVAPSGPFFDLDGTYIDGRQSYPLRVDATDAGAGITRIAVEHTGWPGAQPDLADHSSACDPHHQTPALGTRICPEADAIDQLVDTRPMPEGTRHFRALAADPAGNTGDHRWSVIIDRTAPTSPALSFTTPEEGSAVPVWDAASDPVLPDGTPGAGVAHYRYRHRIGDGDWSDWTTVGADARSGEEVYDQPAGTEVSFEVEAVDAVGNVSEVARTSGQVYGTAPSVSTWGALADAAGGYLSAGSYDVDVTGDDGDGVGIKQLELRLGDQTIASAPGDCAPRTLPDGRPWKALCEPTSGETFSVDTTALPEGRQTLVAQAIDRANNVGQQSWDVTIDHTAPNMPQPGMTAVYSADLDEADVFWDDATDPPLADGSPGSGVTGYVYRFDKGDGWSDWQQTDGTVFTVSGSFVGQQINVEVRSRDAAGNLSDAVASSATVETPSARIGATFFQDDEEQLVSASAGSPAMRMMSGFEPDLSEWIQCKYGSSKDGIPTPADAYGESNVEIQISVSGYCYPLDPADQVANKLAGQTTLTLKACLQVKYGGGWLTLDCDRRTRKGPSESNKLKVVAKDLCRAGTQPYRLQLTTRASAPGLKPDGHTVTNLPTERPCNEAGAWRALAKRGGDPGTQLGKSLLSAKIADDDQDALPKGVPGRKNGGWEPHHIVPKDYGRGTGPFNALARDIQQLAYTCDMQPNYAANGVWLRGPWLYDGTQNWKDLKPKLPPADRNRPEHQPIHTTDYMGWVKEHLESYATMDGKCRSETGMLEALREMKKEIRSGHAEY